MGTSEYHAFFCTCVNIDNFDATKYTLEYDKLSGYGQMAAVLVAKQFTKEVDDDSTTAFRRLQERSRISPMISE